MCFQANRSILLEEEQVRRETENEKESIDLSSIQLQNLMYEKSQCVKAIKSCKDFKSKYSDIELVTEEEFLRDAPDSIKHSVLSNDNAHDLMLKRLNFELFQVMIGNYCTRPTIKWVCDLVVVRFYVSMLVRIPMLQNMSILIYAASLSC